MEIEFVIRRKAQLEALLDEFLRTELKLFTQETGIQISGLSVYFTCLHRISPPVVEHHLSRVELDLDLSSYARPAPKVTPPKRKD